MIGHLGLYDDIVAAPLTWWFGGKVVVVWGGRVGFLMVWGFCGSLGGKGGVVVVWKKEVCSGLG